MRVVLSLLSASSILVYGQDTVPQLERDVIPIFALHCVACHSGAKASAGLDLATADALFRGSSKGPVILNGDSERSRLYQRISNHSMPPPATGKPLSAEQIRTIQRWIDLSAPGAATRPNEAQAREVSAPEITDQDRQFWSFRPPVRPVVPKLKDSAQVRTPIDAFLLAKLQSRRLGFAPEAAKRTLLRRVYFDLTGLPPSPEEVQSFLADSKPGAYERLIERLLDSPHYGERWGRHWLDVAGYSDTKGLDNDAADRFLFVNDGIWKYRDYVVRSFNQDKPYDRFLTEQLAGDELVDWRNTEKFTPAILDSLVATGYLRHVTYRNGHEAAFQMIETFSSGVLGLTVNCARCHDHKYDPIPQRDYYRLLAVFAPALMPAGKSQSNEDFLPAVSNPERAEIEKYNAELEKSIAPLQKQLDEIRRPQEERLIARKLSLLPEILRADVRKALETPPEKRDAAQKYLAAKLEKLLKVDPKEVLEALSEKERAGYEKLQGHVDTLKLWRRGYEKIQVGWEPAPPAPVHLLFRGDPKTPGPVVEPGFPTVLSRPGQSGVERPAELAGESSGRRLALARWLVRPDHPLTARVIVNRVWQHYFGKGIVATPENFGRAGAAPAHPELLDWLAVDFVENGWRFKRLHKMIVTSAAYRQDSVHPQAEEGDPGNELLGRANLRRLEAEIVRDSVLAVSGILDRRLGGEATPLEIGPEGLITAAEKGSSRRSLYIFARRNYPLTFLDVFDYPLMAVNCTRRVHSATPLQSLALLNSEFILEQAAHFADRVNTLAGGRASLNKKIETAFLLALTRPPNPKELALAESHIQRQIEHYGNVKFSPEEAAQRALASMCQMLMASNEFLYLE